MTSSTDEAAATAYSDSTATISFAVRRDATSLSGLGDDVCLGGRGKDIYFFATGDGNDKIRLGGRDDLNLTGQLSPALSSWT